MASTYVARVYPAPIVINHGDAIHYDPEKAITDADLGYEGQEPDRLNGRLDFSVAQGEQGEQGEQGIQGIQGEQGEAGVVDESLDYTWTGAHTFTDIAYADTYWEDLRVPVGAIAVQGQQNIPDWEAFLGDLQVLSFDPGTMEQVFFTAQIPHSYKEGTDIEVHVHWTPAIGGVQAVHQVRWGLECTWVNMGATFGNPTTLYGSTPTPDEQLIANRHYVTELGDLDGTGKTISSMLVCRLFRNATHEDDDYTGDAGLLEIDFHYEIDRPGSREEYVK